MTFDHSRLQYVIAGSVAIALTRGAMAGAFWVQPHDFVSFLPAEEGTAVSSARTADDFGFGLIFLTSIEVDMVVSYPNVPSTFRVEVLSDDNGQPGEVVLSFDNPNVTDLGPWNGDPDLHHFRVFFDTGLTRLDSDDYWLSPYGVGNGTGTDRAFWGTSEFGNPTLEQGMFRSAEFGFPNWTGVSHPDLLGEESGFAFTLDGMLPAPGVLTVFLGAAMVGPKRRRRD